jgi:aspartyl-tRNA(Asn)/glutamyl-tRNA(Gln) amidotransferase subunit B
MPELPDELRNKLRNLGLDSSQVDVLLYEPELAYFMSALIDGHDEKTARTIANWLTGEVKRWVADGDVAWTQVIDKEAQLTKLVGLVDGGSLSSTAAKEVLAEVLKAGGDPEEIAKAKDLIQESDEGALVMIVQQVISENEKAAEDVRGGEMKAIGFLVGQVMKASQGKANPAVVQQLIKKVLGV